VASERWDRHFLGLSLFHAMLSKDPATRVGSVIVGPDREILSAGFNGFPRGIADTPERLADREMKLRLMVHAEMNALLAAARTGMRLKGCTLYLGATDDSGLVWGGPPCTRCTVEIIQVGIGEIVSFPVKPQPSKWHEDLKLAHLLIEEAGISYREIPLDVYQQAVANSMVEARRG
jgi:dCMP deaminase